MRIGNPSVKRWARKCESGELGVMTAPAGYKGVYGKSAIYGALTLVSALVIALALIGSVSSGNLSVVLLASVGLSASIIPMVVISLVIVFVPSTVKVLGCVYCVIQGAFLGVISLLFDTIAPGVAIAALLGTVIVFIFAVALNRLLAPRISSAFMRGMFIAFISFLVIQLFMLLLSWVGLVNYTAYLWIQMLASGLCIIWATAMLMMDLRTIDYMVAAGVDKSYEWNMAFSLVTTLIYLYAEILEFLVRIFMIAGNRK